MTLTRLGAALATVVTLAIAIDARAITLTSYAAPALADVSCPGNVGISLGPLAQSTDGNVWFTVPYSSLMGYWVPGTQTFNLVCAANGSTGPYNIALGNSAFSGGIATGSDGKVWALGSGDDSNGGHELIARSTTAGAVDVFFITPGADGGITSGPDDNMWGTGFYTDSVVQITPAKVTKEYPLPTGSHPFQLVTGPDGNLWITEVGTNSIASFNPTTGTITQFVLPNTVGGGTQYPSPAYISSGGGFLWYTRTDSQGNAYIGKLTTAGIITEYTAAAGSNLTAGSGPLVYGPDGNVWVTGGATTSGGSTVTTAVTKLDTTTGQISVFPFNSSNVFHFNAILATADGNLWVSETPPGLGLLSGIAKVPSVTPTPDPAPVTPTPSKASGGGSMQLDTLIVLAFLVGRVARRKLMLPRQSRTV